MKILIVDDSSAMRMILRKMLTDLGASTSEAANGLEALKHLEGPEIPDALLVDWAMPEMDGYELLLQVRARPEYDAIKVIMVTSESRPESVQKALAGGADEYVMKPFTVEALDDKLILCGLKRD
jgi:two-component system, chemotaxis family, chemotaxis protein CheY